jgi:hypothetical protein
LKRIFLKKIPSNIPLDIERVQKGKMLEELQEDYAKMYGRNPKEGEEYLIFLYIRIK